MSDPLKIVEVIIGYRYKVPNSILDDVIDQTEMIGEDTVEPTAPSERPKRNAKLPIRFRNDYILE
ncbi:hypothetical protein A3Q56_03666 [Intoshia linei]|uniref:Uncharacterized protein n=1 Tax=Intoshia linei TaxID=1819745 RepID=A0A177B4C6_9BILA|nr:hypothetical protein A3Q56_03666 [Intoshia linei]